MAASEIAILAPFLTFLLVITVDFARLYYGYIAIAACARNGASWAASTTTVEKQYPKYDSTKSFAQNLALVVQDEPNNTLSPSPTAGTPQYCSKCDGTGTHQDGTGTGWATYDPWTGTRPTDGYVQVTVSWTFTTLIDYPSFPGLSGTVFPKVPHTTTLSRTVTMRVIPSSS